MYIGCHMPEGPGSEIKRFKETKEFMLEEVEKMLCAPFSTCLQTPCSIFNFHFIRQQYV